MFDPFNKPLEQIAISDLEELQKRNVAENMFIEYKKDFPSSSKISNSIASFANTHGGWYIIGVETDPKSNVPKSFPGFSLTQHMSPKEKMRDIIRDHTSPVLQVESHLIRVDNDRAVLVVKIDESIEAPHITQDGRIYRRNGEGSDPIAESDRYAIDNIYAKGKNFEAIIDKFVQNNITVSRGEEENGWMEIYLMPYPFGKFKRSSDFGSEVEVSKMKEFLSSEPKVTNGFSAKILFNVAYPSTDSIIFRNTTPANHAFFLGLTYRPYVNGSCKIIIPFRYLDIESTEQQIDTNLVRDAITTRVDSVNLGLCKIIDGFSLLTSFVALVTKHIEYLRSKDWTGYLIPFYKLENTWRTILCLNSDAFRSQIENHGVPICMEDNGMIPYDLTPNWKVEMPEEGIEFISHFAYAAEHFGIFRETWANSIEAWQKWSVRTNKL